MSQRHLVKGKLTSRGKYDKYNDEYEDEEEKEEERKLLRKMDSRLLPLVTLLYVLSFLDRVNIGNAKLANIEEDLGLTGNQYNWSLAIFFIGYVLFEVPSNIMLAKTKPSIWIPTIMVGWGIVMTLMALVIDFEQLMAARFFLGAFEAGLFPGIVFFITMWYIRSEQNYRIGIIYAGATLAGAFSGLIAYFIMNLDNKFGISGWQWIFLIDGLITILIALLAYFFISDYPETAKFLTNNERTLAIKRLKYDAGSGHLTHFEKEYVLAAIKDWKVWSAMFIYIGIVIPVYSFSFFIPAIVNGMGFDTVISQLLAAPPFIFGSISTVIVAITSDRLATRGLLLLICCVISILGYLLLIIPGISTPGKYTGACIVGIGIFPSVPTSITWLNNNLAGNVKRATGSAMMIAFGNIGGAISSQIYQSNEYTIGHMIAVCFLFVTIAFIIIQYGLLKMENKTKIRNPEQILAGRSDSEIRNLGDLHPEFIYSL
ncbi:hypothetical protein Glove_428g67 [Diversispora epigaea]|uniref:Major facilitator superfamily (MFS) profile domain-containing protein n=1 Tax=Diversispora epigaea TaxID=1348612 RepID=A0A397GXY9_9GLOM|nr:hypothetical protein Glove_428g67 [Diversispora epigaea]